MVFRSSGELDYVLSLSRMPMLVTENIHCTYTGTGGYKLLCDAGGVIHTFYIHSIR